MPRVHMVDERDLPDDSREHYRVTTLAVDHS